MAYENLSNLHGDVRKQRIAKSHPNRILRCHLAIENFSYNYLMYATIHTNLPTYFTLILKKELFFYITTTSYRINTFVKLYRWQIIKNTVLFTL